MGKVFQLFSQEVGNFLRNPDVPNDIEPINAELLIANKLQQSVQDSLLSDMISIRSYFNIAKTQVLNEAKKEK